MTVLQALVLGIVQGLTEFLPISSSAHLVIVPWTLGWRFDPAFAFAFDVLVQMGTLLAVVVYFAPTLVAMLRAFVLGLARRAPLTDPLARQAWWIVLGTLPALVAGLALHDAVEAAFGSPAAVFGFLVVTAALLAAAERFGRSERTLDDLRAPEAAFVGVMQALALFPGISRSGSTIAGGLLRRLRRPEAAKFSFLLSIPAMLGAGVVAARDLIRTGPGADALLPLAVGFTAAAISGYIVIRWLLAYLARGRLIGFAAYCLVLGAVGLALTWLRT